MSEHPANTKEAPRFDSTAVNYRRLGLVLLFFYLVSAR